MEETLPAKKLKKLVVYQPVLQFVKLSKNAFTPTRGSTYAAGFDIYSAYDYTIPSMGKERIKTDIAIGLPPGCYGRIGG